MMTTLFLLWLIAIGFLFLFLFAGFILYLINLLWKRNRYEM